MKSPHGPFWRQVITVLSGSFVAQLLPIAAAPLITRLCTPEDIGNFSVWLGVVSAAAVAATLRLETAMILDRDEAEQATCFGIVAYAASALAGTLALLVVGARLSGLPLSLRMPWVALLSVGPAIWLNAYISTTLAYATSHNAFGKAARAKIWCAGTIAALQVGLLLAGAGGAALFAGQLLGLLTGLVSAQVLLAPPRARLGLRLDARARAYLDKHSNFLRFTLPSDLLSSIIGQLPLLMIGLQFGALEAGLFALTQRVLSAPISLLAASVLEVFKRQSVQDFQALGNCKESYQYTFKVLFLIGAGPSLLLFLFAPPLFALAFGATWRPAGELASLLSPLYFLSFLGSPLSYVFYVAGRQRAELFWQLALLGVTATAFVLPTNMHACIVAYACGRSLLYLVYLHMSYRYAQNRLLLV